MNPADPAGGKYFYPGPMGGKHRPGNGGAATFLLEDGCGKIPAADLADVFFIRQAFQFRIGQANVNFAIQYGDGGRRGAVFTDHAFHITGKRQVLRARQAVGDDGGFQSNCILSRV